MRVLLVEDYEDNRDMLTGRLQRRGFDVVVATNGEEAVAVAQRDLPDVILMDMGLPVMDGWTAASHIKEDARTRHIPIIALTAYAMDDVDRDKALNAGCDDYCGKPVDFTVLVEKIQGLAPSAPVDHQA
jgi:CheY-like chemotaxis protein